MLKYFIKVSDFQKMSEKIINDLKKIKNVLTETDIKLIKLFLNIDAPVPSPPPSQFSSSQPLSSTWNNVNETERVDDSTGNGNSDDDNDAGSPEPLSKLPS